MKNYRKTIVVFGCTGAVGSHVLKLLLKENCVVRGVLRHPQKSYPISLEYHSDLTYVFADQSVKEQVDTACAFSDTVFLLTATHPDMIEYEDNIINSCVEQGVQRIVKLSAPLVEPDNLVKAGCWHRMIESRLEVSGIEFCCIRPHAFMQNWERNTFTIQWFDKFYGAAGDAPRNYVDARDVAAVAVKFLTQDEPLKSQYVTLSGPELLTNRQMATRLSQITDRKIEYVNVSSNELLKLLTTKARLPLWLATHIVELDELALKVPEPTCDSTEKILHKKPRLMNSYLIESRQHFEKKPRWKFW